MMLETYVYCGAQKLRCGYTTGSCAAAGAKAAAELLLSGVYSPTVNLMTPKGIPLTLSVLSPTLDGTTASCLIQKDSGDDPDITNQIKIQTTVSKQEEGVTITGGEGVGIVTKPGLDQPVGEFAINSMPRKMITEAVMEVAETHHYSGGFLVTISVPNGAEIAKRTYNPYMGIEGGISIIGTSGIVEPMSTTALIDTIRAEANMRKADGHKNLLLTLGNYGEAFLSSELPDLLSHSVKCSNFIGDAIDIGIALSFKRILLVGHMGKLVKLGTGIMNTHSAQADGRMDVLVTCGVLADMEPSILKQIPQCVTVDSALDLMQQSEQFAKTMEILAQRVDYYLKKKVKNQVEIGAVLFSDKHLLTVKTTNADAIIQYLKEDYHGTVCGSRLRSGGSDHPAG